MNANMSYRTSQVNTASREQLLLMTYDGLLRFLTEARRAMADRQYEAQNKNITRAQDLLMELLYTLDHEAAPEIANNLDRLYRFIFDQLTQANVHDDMQSLEKMIRLIADLREAWAEAVIMARCPSAQSVMEGAMS